MQPFIKISHQLNKQMKIQKIKHDETYNIGHINTSFNVNEL
jgi:hypothetical protein